MLGLSDATAAWSLEAFEPSRGAPPSSVHYIHTLMAEETIQGTNLLTGTLLTDL